MGNKGLQCSGQKHQLLFEATAEITEHVDEWLGCGLLVAERTATRGELRLPVNLSSVPRLRVCKRIARRPRDDEFSEGSASGIQGSKASRASLNSARTKGLALDVAAREYSLMFMHDVDPECHRECQMLLVDDGASPDDARPETDVRNIAEIVRSCCAAKDNFSVVVYSEMGSVSFKRQFSPFKDAGNVDENVKRALQENDLPMFAVNYGNCLVEKAFCGGVLCLRFSKEGSTRPAAHDGLNETAFDVQVGSSTFSVAKSQRGGGMAVDSHSKKAIPLDHVEKLVKQWLKTFETSQKNASQVVRLKLAPFSRVEGIQAPGALTRMDFDQTALVERAKEELDRATKTRNLDDLQTAVNQADAASLDDDRLPELRETCKQLSIAVASLRDASRKGDVEALRTALTCSTEVGLPDWDRALHDEASHKLASLDEQHIKSRLEQASLAKDVHVEVLVNVLCDALDSGYTSNEEFSRAQARLTEILGDLTEKAKADALGTDQALACMKNLQRLPEHPQLSRANLSDTLFASAVSAMNLRAEARRESEQHRGELENKLQSTMSSLDPCSYGDTSSHDILETTLQQTDQFLSTNGGDASGSDATLQKLRRQATSMLESKRAMDRTAEHVESRLREACLADTSSPETLEAALQDLDVKHGSGALHRSAVSAPVVDSARRQLLALLRPELDAYLQQAQDASTERPEDAKAFVASAKRLLQRMETLCAPTCRAECGEAAMKVKVVHEELEAETGRRSAHEAARERLKHCVDSGDPRCVEEALQQAHACGLPDADTLSASARLRELQTTERQLQSAIETGDRVHLSIALEEAVRQRLRTSMVDEAQQRLQSSKTHALVTAIKQRDYVALGSAVAEAERRHPDEVAEIGDVLEQARAEHSRLDKIAKAVTAALGSLNYDDLRCSVDEAQRLNVMTDDVRRAETALAAMDQALEKLSAAAQRTPRDLAALQEGLHYARQQGLQAHPEYRKAEDVFAGTCMLPGMVWAFEELREMWVVLCLRCPLPSTSGGAPDADRELRMIAHPLPTVVAELCHAAQISPETEPYPVQYIVYVLARLTSVGEEGSDATEVRQRADAQQLKLPTELQNAVFGALGDFSGDPVDGSHAMSQPDPQATVGAAQFNRIGLLANQAGLDSSALLLWWLVCIVEWETGQRLLVASMSEHSLRTGNLVNEAESTGRSLRTQLVALQAGGDSGQAGGAQPGAAPAAADVRVVAVRSVLDEIDHVKREAEKLQGKISKNKVEGCTEQDLSRILEILRQKRPRSLDEARAALAAVREASVRAREICGDTYCALEAKMLQMHYKGRQALDGEAEDASVSRPVTNAAASATPMQSCETINSLPFAMYSPHSEAAPTLQDHAILQLLGVPETSLKVSQDIDRCFQRVEVYEHFSEKTGAVEDEFESFCRKAVAEARQRCGDRRLVAALKPLLVDLVKRRQRLSSILNTLRNCGLDKAERNLLRKHLQPRDVLIALTFSSMAPGPSQSRMIHMAAKTDCPLPLLFGWAQPGTSGNAGGLQLCTQIHWVAMREVYCVPSNPLVLSIGTRDTLGKSYLLQYLYALQECHTRAAANPPVRIHAMPSIDIIGDFAREEQLRGVSLADVHTYDPAEGLCQALVATLASSAALLLLQVSLQKDFPTLEGDRNANTRMSTDFAAMVSTLAAALAVLPESERDGNVPTVLVLLRDVDPDENGPTEQKRVFACVEVIRKGLNSSGRPEPTVLAWPVPPLSSLGPAELANEIKTLRKSRALVGTVRGGAPPLEEILARATRSPKNLPSISVLQERCASFAGMFKESHGPGIAPLPNLCHESYGPLAQRIFRELDAIGSSEGILRGLFPITICHQHLTTVLQEKVRCLSRGREYLEPEERKKLETNVEGLDREITRLRCLRQQVPPPALLQTFAQLVLEGKIEAIVEFGACLDDWKQKRRAPLLDEKLRLRKELDQLLDDSQDRSNDKGPGRHAARVTACASRTGDADDQDGRVSELRGKLTDLQRRLDEIDVSTDSFWLELMLWQEMDRIGSRQALVQLNQRLTVSACKATYLSWVKNGNPVHFLHSTPLQFGAFEPLRWHPQISGASLFGSDFIGDILRELDRDLGVDVRRRPLVVISVIGVQSSGKSTLMNYLFGCSFVTHSGRCTKGLYISLLETKRELVLILDTEGLLSVEARDDVFDKQVALMTMACSDLVIVNNRGELGRHVGDLFQVCLFALYHLKLAKISPAIGFVLQCLSMVNQQQQYEWVATVKKSLEESVQELQQRERPGAFKLQDLVFLDNESIFVMPSAFNNDVQFGLQVSRPTNLYALKALQLREKVFRWISRAKASHKQRLREAATGTSDAAGLDISGPDTGNASFASLSQWYEHARTVWQTLSMCGTDLLQFRTMRQVLMAQQLQEFCDAFVQKHVDERLSKECESLIERRTQDLRTAQTAKDVHVVDNAFRGQLDSLRDAALQEMHHEFDEFVKAHDQKFTDEQVKNDKRFSLMGPMRRKYASVDSLWRSRVYLALEQRSMDTLFDDISARVNDLLVEQGANVNVQNVELVFEDKWNQVMAETLRKQRPNLERVVQEVVWHFNAALSTLKAQFRKAHIFHGVKALSVQELGSDHEICNSFLQSKKGVGDALVPAVLPQSLSNVRLQVDNLWIKLVDAMRLEIDQQGQMSDATALKILNRLNSEIEAGDQLRQLLHTLGSTFVQRIVKEIVRATMQFRYQIEQQNFQSRVNEVLGKKQQKLWEIQARVDSGKREVHCAKVWAKTFVDTLDKHFRNAVGRMAQEIVSHMSNILTNPGNACELAIERSFTKRNWRHVVMYAIDPTQYLFMEFHKEWEQFKQGLVDQYCQELKSNFGNCIRIAEERIQGYLSLTSAGGEQAGVKDMSMNRLSQVLRDACKELADESLGGVLCTCLPSFSSDFDWPLKNFEQFTQFVSVELRRYRANMRATEISVERRMESELCRQKADCWKCICGCPARCPGCGTKCNLESENHWPERPHECRRHVYPAFNGWQKQDGRKPFLLHCRAKAQWQIARTRPPVEPGGRERYWDNFQAMLEDEHPDWLDPATRKALPSMEPLEEYEEGCTTAPEHIQREIEENRRAWANCKDALLEHFTSMADDTDLDWLEKYKREGGALGPEEFVSIRDELFAVTPLETMESLDNTLPVDDNVTGDPF
jgi:hypothetical protein